jgi:hypothetical protein
MGTIDLQFASELRDKLELERAIETGTYRGITARALASVFEAVITIELSPVIHERAVTMLRAYPNVVPVLGRSPDVLRTIAQRDVPTLFFLDGHWSGGYTAGSDEECPLLDELAAIGSGHQDDCFVVDDARLFTSPPPPPHDPDQWPTILEIFDAIRLHHPSHTVTLLSDQIIAVPPCAKQVLADYGTRLREDAIGLRHRFLRLLLQVREHVNRSTRQTRASKSGA